MPLDRALREREPNEKAMQAVQIALSDPDTDPETVGDCVEKLSEWLRRQAQNTQKMMAQCRLSSVVVEVMRNHAEDLEVARYCCRIIHGVANRHAENTTNLCKAGVVYGLNKVIDCHMDDAQVQESGAQALEILAAKNAAREIIATGGISRLVTIMSCHPDNTYIQRACWSCLDQVVTNGGALTESMRDEIVGAADLVHRATHAMMLSTHPADKMAQKKAEKLRNYVQSCVLEKDRKTVVVPQPKKKEEPRPEESVRVQQEELDLRGWLLEVDHTGALASYHSILVSNFDSVTHLVSSYTEDGALDPAFFEDLEVNRIGHRRKFEQWFKQHLQERKAADT